MAKKLMLEEQETYIRYDTIDKCWYADTSYPPHWRKFEKKNWECIRTDYFDDGTVMGKKFKSVGKKGISITDPTKVRVMSEEDKELARQRFAATRKAMSEKADDILDDIEEDIEDILDEEDYEDED